MRRLILLFVLSSLTIFSFSQNQQDRILGRWVNEKKTMQIEFSGSETYSAKIVWMAESKNKNGKPLLDEKNPNPSLRKNTLIGTVIIWGLYYENGVYSRGKIYLPRKGLVVDGEIQLLSDNKFEITARKGLMSNSQTWTRL